MLIQSLNKPFVLENPIENESFVQVIEHLSILSNVFITPNYDTIDITLSKNLIDSGLYALNSFPLDKDNVASTLLDSGLPVLFFNYSSEYESADIQLVLNSFPRYRIGLSVNTDDLTLFETVVSQYRQFAGHFTWNLTKESLSEEQITEIVANLKKLLKVPDFSIELYINLPPNHTLSQSNIIRLATSLERLQLAVEPRFKLEGQANIDHLTKELVAISGSSESDFLDSFIGCLKTDRTDNLYTTVVCDENNVTLGLVYSNAESIRAAFLERRGIYWSRSRQSLWRKGDTSGMEQILLKVQTDCDRDALKFTTIQNGNPPAFCHLLTRSCWGPESGFVKLQRTLQERKTNAPPGSYTKRLFDDETLLRKKLLEEAQELIEAKEKDHIASEAADVMYFMLTRCVAAGVTLSDIEAQLDKRSLKITRRPGNAKEWRTQEAEKILAESSNK